MRLTLREVIQCFTGWTLCRIDAGCWCYVTVISVRGMLRASCVATPTSGSQSQRSLLVKCYAVTGNTLGFRLQRTRPLGRSTENYMYSRAKPERVLTVWGETRMSQRLSMCSRMMHQLAICLPAPGPVLAMIPFTTIGIERVIKPMARIDL